jgi:hypothetical protein
VSGQEYRNRDLLEQIVTIDRKDANSIELLSLELVVANVRTIIY